MSKLNDETLSEKLKHDLDISDGKIKPDEKKKNKRTGKAALVSGIVLAVLSIIPSLFVYLLGGSFISADEASAIIVSALIFVPLLLLVGLIASVLQILSIVCFSRNFGSDSDKKIKKLSIIFAVITILILIANIVFIVIALNTPHA